jgi:hypothetical protein
MSMFARGNAAPPWLNETQQFCESAQITITGWGPDLLSVEAESPQRARQIASQLAPLGFHTIENEADAYAGILNLSPNPAALRGHMRGVDIGRRPVGESVEPLIWAFCSVLVVPGLDPGAPSRYWEGLPFGILALGLFLWEASRVWGWRLALTAEAVHVRRFFRWATIPWREIRAVEMVYHGKRQERVLLQLEGQKQESLGTFSCEFAQQLRNRLREEAGWRSGTAE